MCTPAIELDDRSKGACAARSSFSPRSQRLVGDFGKRDQSVLARLGPHRTGRGCL
jgi:hypothetical protein